MTQTFVYWINDNYTCISRKNKYVDFYICVPINVIRKIKNFNMAIVHTIVEKIQTKCI